MAHGQQCLDRIRIRRCSPCRGQSPDSLSVETRYPSLTLVPSLDACPSRPDGNPLDTVETVGRPTSWKQEWYPGSRWHMPAVARGGCLRQRRTRGTRELKARQCRALRQGSELQPVPRQPGNWPAGRQLTVRKRTVVSAREHQRPRQPNERLCPAVTVWTADRQKCLRGRARDDAGTARRPRRTTDGGIPAHGAIDREGPTRRRMPGYLPALMLVAAPVCLT